MAFKKTGVVPIRKIVCSCGFTLQGVISACPKCGKTLVPENLQTSKPAAEEPTEDSTVK